MSVLRTAVNHFFYGKKVNVKKFEFKIINFSNALNGNALTDI